VKVIIKHNFFVQIANYKLDLSRYRRKSMSVNKILILLTLISLTISCSNTKFLAENQKLYTRTGFKWKGKKNVEKLPFKIYDISYTAYARTNWNYLTFSRSGLTFYNYWKPSKTWGLRHYAWSVLSKPPVLLSKVKPESRLLKMRQTLFNYGHFDSTIDLELRIKGKRNKKAQAIYTIYLKDSYKFRTYNYYSKSSALDYLIVNSLKDSYIKVGEEYWEKNITNERQRVTDFLRNKGYFFFKPSYLIFDMDTSVDYKKIDVALRIKNNISESNKQKYSVNSVAIYFNTDKDSIKDIPLVYDSLNNVFYQEQDFYKPKYINREISLLDDSIYKLDNHNITLSYLNSFGIFKLSKILYSKDSLRNNSLNAHIFLMPRKPITTALAMNFATKSNDFLGPFAVLSISHNNIFKGAEKLSVHLNGGLEWQKKSKRKEYDLGLNSYEIGARVMLEFPRFLLPFRFNYKNKKIIPRTYIITGFKIIRRVKYYQMNLIHANFGYKWNPNLNMAIKVEPFTFNYIKMPDKSPDFTKYLLEYPSVARSFGEQLIVGSTYNLTSQMHSKNNILKNYYNSITLDLAGNLLNLFISNNNKDKDLAPGALFDINYSQYFKIIEDFRYYLRLSPKSQFVTRLIGGVGIPYNQSSVLPYIKQFFMGGSNDLRAFYARTVGPGSYKKNKSESGLLLDQSGEIKIAGNLEYRFPIIEKLNGALFLDAGNVWLFNEDTSRVGGKFSLNTFYQQIAVGFGFGARIDLDYVILRLDLAIPLRKPYKEYNKYWTFTSPHLFSDYVLSFAVGYPF